ncbi:MAG: DNA replication and repair protein RecF [Candidatus Blackburnbacteria bacterium]|nr:DNA replication and repair protein RecF [Candidatus Blackburnbacteria bacterium]
MLIKNLKLQNFRNFEKKSFDFSEGSTIIFGPNAAGKTNILEAINLLSSGKSFRAGVEAEMIKEGEGISRVEGEVVENVKLEVVLVGETEHQRGGKRVLVNGVSKRVFTFAGTLKTVMFGPWDVGMVTSPPGVRRKFLDNVLGQVDREYRRSLLSYEKGIRQRNRVLERIREGIATRSQLLYWDHLVIREGNYLSSARERFIDFVNSTTFPGEELSIEYDHSAISEGRLEQYRQEEVMAATTLVGPHRDDFVFKIKGSRRNKGNMGWELSKYGSRGEQRMAVLWLKLAELDFIEKESGERPVLLLDDIFSELDPQHHEMVMKTVGRQQTILTAAEPREVGKSSMVKIIELTPQEQYNIS